MLSPPLRPSHGHWTSGGSPYGVAGECDGTYRALPALFTALAVAVLPSVFGEGVGRVVGAVGGGGLFGSVSHCLGWVKGKKKPRSPGVGGGV